jgi:cytidine deaminase
LSADLSRQVGASLLSTAGQTLSVGTNEVPRRGGGFYWAGDHDDARDFKLGQNSTATMRRRVVVEIVERLVANGWRPPGHESPPEVEELADIVISQLEGTRVMELGEFVRTVHAEMAAILDAARRGVSTEGAALYSTTFPCHNCAKHIVSSGICRVVYIEPYPESLARELYPDSIEVEPSAEGSKKIPFHPFVGVAPRRFVELFTAPIRKDPATKFPVEWKAGSSTPRLPRQVAEPNYFAAEAAAIQTLRKKLTELGWTSESGSS